eukprot:scaffold214886_cov23-Prasinocladus_malaysianus.AAC.1
MPSSLLGLLIIASGAGTLRCNCGTSEAVILCLFFTLSAWLGSSWSLCTDILKKMHSHYMLTP